MTRLLSLLVAGLLTQAALADEPNATEQKPAATSETAVAATAAGEKVKEFKPPPGFYTKTRGSLKVYCKKDREIGTRFVTEKCMTEAQVHDYLLALETQKQDVDKIRSTCGGGSACATN